MLCQITAVCQVYLLPLWCCLVAQSCLTLATSWTITHQAPMLIGFPRQEYWSGLPFPSPGDLPDPGIKPASPASLQCCRWLHWVIREALYLLLNGGKDRDSLERNLVSMAISNDMNLRWNMNIMASDGNIMPWILWQVFLFFLSNINQKVEVSK